MDENVSLLFLVVILSICPLFALELGVKR